MAGLLLRRRPYVKAEDKAAAAKLSDRVDAVREAERALAAAEEADVNGFEARALRQQLDRRFAAAIESAEAAYNMVTGDLTRLSRVKQLKQLVRHDVQDADRVRRELALARTHYRVAARDDLVTVRINALPPSVGTHATTLATHLEGH